MSKRKGRKPEFTALGVRLVGEILSGSSDAMAEFINWRSADHKQLLQYMSLPELRPLWEARDRLPDDLVEFIEPWCADDGVRRKQNSVEAKRRKAEERLAQEEEAAADADNAVGGMADLAWEEAAPEPAEAAAPEPSDVAEDQAASQAALPPPRSPEEVLGIQQGATAHEVKRAFRAKAARAHPDRQGGSTAAMAELNAARDTLLGRD
jgi:hypothetical protein